MKVFRGSSWMRELRRLRGKERNGGGGQGGEGRTLLWVTKVLCRQKLWTDYALPYYQFCTYPSGSGTVLLIMPLIVFALAGQQMRTECAAAVVARVTELCSHLHRRGGHLNIPVILPSFSVRYFFFLTMLGFDIYLSFQGCTKIGSI